MAGEREPQGSQGKNNAGLTIGSLRKNTAQSFVPPEIFVRRKEFERIALVGKRVLILECLAHCISSEFGCVVSTFDDFSVFREDPANLKFSLVVLVDENARGCSVAEAVGALAISGTPLMVVSQGGDSKRIAELLKSGVRGCIPSTTTIKIALQAMRLVLVGGTFVPANYFQEDGSQGLRAMLEDANGAPLTKREVEVARSMKEGKANKLIAHELHMSECTVKAHVHNILKKLQAANRTEAVIKLRAFIRAGIID